MYSSAADFIEAKGGPAALAAQVGYSPGAVRQWKFRGIIPRDAWPNILKACPDTTLDKLMELESRSPRRSRAAA